MIDHPYTFTIILEPAEEGGFIVTVPALPEVGTQGDTYEDALRTDGTSSESLDAGCTLQCVDRIQEKRRTYFAESPKQRA
jgi:hypothetical protein